MNTMKLKKLCLLVGILFFAPGTAFAQNGALSTTLFKLDNVIGSDAFGKVFIQGSIICY